MCVKVFHFPLNMRMECIMKTNTIKLMKTIIKYMHNHILQDLILFYDF